MADEWVDAPADDWQDVAPAAPPLAQLQPKFGFSDIGEAQQPDVRSPAEMADMAATLGSTAIPYAQLVGGVAGLGTAAAHMLGLTDKEGADAAREVTEAMQYRPRTEAGERTQDTLNSLMEPIEKGSRWLGDTVQDQANSGNLMALGITPDMGAAAGAAAYTAGNVSPFVALDAGVKGGVKSLRSEVPHDIEVAPEAAKAVDDVPKATGTAPDMQAAIDAGNADPLLGKRPEPTPRQSQEYSLNQSFLRDEGGRGYDIEAPDTKVELKDHGFSEPEISDMADKGMAHPDGSMDREQFWNWKNDTPADKAPDVTPSTLTSITPTAAEDLKARGYSDASIKQMSVDEAREVLGLPGDLDSTLDPKTRTFTRALLDDPATAPDARAWLEQNAHDPAQVKAALEHAAAKHEELEPHVYPTEDVQAQRGGDPAREAPQPGSPDESAQARPREGEPIAREAPAPGVAETERAAGAASRIATDSVSEPLREVSARNAAIDAHREAMGLEPLPVAERKSFETSAQQARDMLAKDPAAPQRIVAEHTATGRALSDPEQLVLAEHSAKLGREHEAATAEINRAREAGDQPAGAIAALRRESIENEARGVHKALNEGGGTANARGLAIRNAILKDDYSVGRNMARAEAHYSGLNDRLRSQARDLTEHIKKSQDELERVQAQVEKERAAKPAERPAREAKRPQSADEREQARIEKKIAQLKSDIERRLKACPV